MRLALPFLAAAFVLTACFPVADKLAEPGPVKGTPPPKRQTLIVTDADEGRNQKKNCELKNPAGSGRCEDGRNPVEPAKPKPTETKAAARTDRPFQPSDCTTYGLGGYALLAELGHRMKEWKAYCNAEAAAPAEPAAVPTPATGAGGSCEWKGRRYQPGDSIHYQSAGEIHMRDVLVDGKPFWTLVPSGAHLSSPEDRAQLCECSTSSGHWVCV